MQRNLSLLMSLLGSGQRQAKTAMSKVAAIKLTLKRFGTKKFMLLIAVFAVLVFVLALLRYVFWVRQVNETMDSIWQGRFAKAREEARTAIQMMSWFPDSKSFALSLRLMTSIYACRRQFRQAELYNQKLLEFDKRTWGTKSREYAGDISELALMKRKQRQFVESKRLYEQAIAIYENDGKTSELDLARMQALLAWVLVQQGRNKEALSLIEKSDKVICNTLGESHFERLVGLVERAYIHKLDSNSDAMTKDLELAYKLCSSPLPLEKSSAQTVVVLNLLAQTFAEQNQLEKAEKIFEIAESNCKSSVFAGGYNTYMADILEPHALLLEKLGHKQEAIVLKRRAAQIRGLTLSIRGQTKVI